MIPSVNDPRPRLTPAEYARAQTEGRTDAELRAQGFDLPNGPPGGQVAVNDTLGAAQGQAPKSANRRQLTHAEYNRAVNGKDLSGRYGDKFTDDELRAQGYDLPDVGGGRMAENAGLGAAEGVTLGNAAELYGAVAAAAGALREREPGDLWGTMAGRMPERQNPSPDRNPKPPSLSDLYISKRDEARDRIATAHRENPLLTGGSELVAGFIAPGGFAAKGYRTAKAAQALNKLSPLLEALAASKVAAKTAGTVGAVQGGVYGLGRSGEETRGGITNPLSQATDMLVGGGVGGTVGAGIGGAIPLVVPVGKALVGAAKGAVRKLGVTTAKSRAATNAQRILDEIQAAGSSPESVVAREQKIVDQPRLSLPAENSGTALDAMGQAGVNLINRLGPVNPETAGLLNNAARTFSVRNPLRQALIKAAKNREPASSLAEDVLSDGVIATSIAGKTGGLVAGIKNAVGAGTRRSGLNENLDLVRSLLDPVDGGTLQRTLSPDPTTKAPGVLRRALMKLRGTPKAPPETLARPGFRNDPYEKVLKKKQLLEQTAVDDFFNPPGVLARAKAAAEPQALRGDVGANEVPIPLLTPPETLPGAQGRVPRERGQATQGQDEPFSHIERHQTLFDESPVSHQEANPDFAKNYASLDDGSGQANFLQKHLAGRLYRGNAQAMRYAEQEARLALPENAGQPRLVTEAPAVNYYQDMLDALDYNTKNNLTTIDGDVNTPGSITYALRKMGRYSEAKAPGTDKATGPFAQDGSDVSGRVGPSTFPDPTMAANRMMSSMSGGAYGATQGDTPRERLKNTLTFAALGVLGPNIIKKIGAVGPRSRAIASIAQPVKAVSTGRFGWHRGATSVERDADRRLTDAVQRALTNPEGEDVIVKRFAQNTGRNLGPTRQVRGGGVWGGEPNPNTTTLFTGTTDWDDAAKVLSSQSLAKGQDGALQWQTIPRGGNAGVVATGPNGGPVPAHLLEEINHRLANDPKFAGQIGATEVDGHLAFIHVPEWAPKGLTGKQFQANVQTFLSDLGAPADQLVVAPQQFRTAVFNGPADYLEKLGRDPDAIQGLRDNLVALQPVYEAHALERGLDPAVVRARFERRIRALESLQKAYEVGPPSKGLRGTPVLETASQLAISENAAWGRPPAAWPSKASSPSQVARVQQRLDDYFYEGVVEGHEAELRGQVAAQWYDEDIAKAHQMLEFAVPEVAEQGAMRTAFNAVWAITSNGQMVTPNTKVAVGVMDQFLQGLRNATSEADLLKLRFTTFDPATWQATKFLNSAGQSRFRAVGEPGTGIAGQLIKGHVRAATGHEFHLNKLTEWWRDAVRATGNAEGAFKHLEERLLSQVLFAKRASSPFAVEEFGQKIGQFFRDVQGVPSDASTVDLWIKRFGDQALGNVSTKIDKKSGSTVIDDGVTPIQNRMMQTSIRQAAERWSEATGERLTPKQVQAKLWYVIKGRFQEAGATFKPGSLDTFADAAARVLSEKGQATLGGLGIAGGVGGAGVAGMAIAEAIAAQKFKQKRQGTP